MSGSRGSLLGACVSRRPSRMQGHQSRILIRISFFPYVSFVMIEETIMAEDESLIDRSFCSFDKSFKICELKLNYILFPSCLKLTETSFFKVSKSLPVDIGPSNFQVYCPDN